MTETTLTPEERSIYQWQMDLEGFGESWQRRLKAASLLVSQVVGMCCIAAAETVKWIDCTGSRLAGVLLTMDLASMKIRLRSDCPVCSCFGAAFPNVAVSFASISPLPAK